MIFELIKGAAHATVSAHGSSAPQHPILVTLGHNKRELMVRVSDQGGGIAPYGGLPPDPADLQLQLSPLGAPPGTLAAAPLSAQRLDIFSFSHMRRFYQHHNANAGASPPPALDATPPLSAGSMPQDPTATGIMALRSVGELAGTVKEQLERHQAQQQELASSLSPSSSSSPGSSSTSTSSAPSSTSSPSSPSSSSTTDPSSRPDLDAQVRNGLALDAQLRSGIGLPLARMYAEYFGGALSIFTCQGYGSDAFLTVPKFGVEGAVPSHGV